MFAIAHQRLVDTTSGLGRLIVQLPGDVYNLAGDFAVSAKKSKIRYYFLYCIRIHELTVSGVASGRTPLASQYMLLCFQH
jgi:hypothetical protein